MVAPSSPCRAVVLITLTLVALAALPALAQQPTPSEEAALEAYRQGAFTRAVSLYTQALAETEEASHRAQLHVRIAWTLFALGREGEVDTHLRAALVEDPTLTLMTDYYTQEFIDLFEAARHRVTSAMSGAGGLTTPVPDLEATLATVDERIATGQDLEGALADVDLLLAAYPNDGRLAPARIRLLELLGRSDEAEQMRQAHGGLLGEQGSMARLSIPDLILRANELLDSGDVDTSLELLREAVSRQPSNVAALELMAEAAGRAARWDEAEFALKSALALQPDNIGLQLRLGEVFLAKDDASAARDVFRHLTVQFPHSDRAWAALGLLDADLGSTDRALDELAKALNENPLLPEVQLAYGELLLLAGDVDSAIEALRSAANLLQFDAQVVARLGQALLARGRWKEALEQLKAGIDGGFAPPDVERSLVLALARQGRLSEAERRLATIAPDARGDGVVLHALIRYERGDFADSQADLMPLLDSRSNDPALLNLLAASLYRQGLYGDALSYFERVHELVPDQPTAEANRARATSARDAVILAAAARPVASSPVGR